MKRMMFALGLALALTSVDASAEPSAKLREQISVMLGAPEYTPSAEEWQKLGPDAAVVLREVALDDKVLILKRGRAASALTYFKGDETKAALTSLIHSDETAWLLRGKAARSLANAYGADSLDTIAPLLKHDQKRLREAAIKAIGSVRSAKSRTLLTAQLKVEKNAHLRKVIEQQLKAQAAEKEGK